MTSRFVSGTEKSIECWSPDGKFEAYRSNESGTPQIYVQNFPPTTARWQISTDYGVMPQWRADGKELFYLSFGGLMAVDIRSSGTTLQPGVPRELFRARIAQGGRNVFFPAADGKKFLAVLPPEDDPNRAITVVVNWAGRLPR